MRHSTVFILASCLALVCLLNPSDALADVRDKKTIITTNAPLKIPNNTLLPAGKYVVKLLDSQGTRNIVQIFNERQDKLYATVLAIPNYRLKPAEETEFTFWETPAGQAMALRSWFYPGDTYGVEFTYPKAAATQLARESSKTVPTVYSKSEKPSELMTARIGATTSEGKEEELETEVYTAPAEAQNESGEATTAQSSGETR